MVKKLLSDNMAKAWMRRMIYSQKTVDTIDDIRHSPPSRKVQGRKRNVSGRFSSTKMGQVIQFEGWVELFAAYEMEFDHECCEFWDQPPVIPLNTPRKTHPIYHHYPDYFVIYRDVAGWLQCKRESELERISNEKPWLYTKNDEGHWRCPPGEEYAAQFGLKFWVKSEKDFSLILADNLMYLEEFYAADFEVPNEQYAKIYEVVRKNPGIPTTKILALCPKIKVDNLLMLVVKNIIYIDLMQFRLSEPDTTAIYTNYELCQAYSEAQAHRRKNHCSIIDIDFWKSFYWDGNPYLIINAGLNEMTVSRITENGEKNSPFSISRKDFIDLVEQSKINGTSLEENGISSEAMTIMDNASPKQLQKANERFKVIEPIVVDGLKLGAGEVSPRVVRDWVRKYRLAEEKYGTGFVGLIDNNPGKGNYGSKLLPQVIALMENVISKEYEIDKNPKPRIVYGSLLIELETNNLPDVSYKTFKQKIAERRGPEQTEKMQGPRAAEQVRPTYHYLEFETPRHGSYPFAILHIDHTQLDVVLLDSQTGKALGKPWLSIAICTYTRRIVAFTLTYDPPSKRTCMILLREIVRRNHRLPKWIVVDNGAEFGSVYFETTTAFYNCHVMKRPPGKPKFGSVCERIFGTTNTQLIHNLAGNTQIMKRVRIMTKSHNPQKLATWTLFELYLALEEYFFEVYDIIEHPALRGQTPREAFVQGCILHGFRDHKPIVYDEHFINHTYPTTKRGTAKIIPTEGVKINYNYYWSEQFRDGKVAGSIVPVRYDPFDASIAKVLIEKRWVTCISTLRNQLAGRSEREIQILTNELKAQDTNHSRTFNITSKKLAENIIKAEGSNEKVALQRMKDLERERVFQLIYGGKSTKGRTSKNAEDVTALPIVSAKPSQKNDVVSKIVVLEDW